MGRQLINCPHCGEDFGVHTDIIDREIDYIMENDFLFYYHKSGKESQRNIELAKENEILRGEIADLKRTKEDKAEEALFIKRFIEDNERK